MTRVDDYAQKLKGKAQQLKGSIQQSTGQETRGTVEKIKGKLTEGIADTKLSVKNLRDRHY